MNIWLAAAAAMMICLIPCGIVCFRGQPIDRVVALEATSTICVLILMLLAEGFGRLPFFDLALTLALLSFAGGLVFARFLERWL